MILFRNGKKEISDGDFRKTIKEFPLKNKTVFVYSRIFSLGRITSKEAVFRLIEILVDAVGSEGTLCIPCYSYSGYKDEIFDPLMTSGTVGVLGDVSRETPGMIRTVHPVYSTVCMGKDAQFLNSQSYYTCFGENSFFDLFSRLGNGFFLMLGTNLSVLTSAHYYDQKFSSPLRFVKKFEASIIENGEKKKIVFDSYVKNYEIYGDKTNCYAKFDAFADDLSIIKRVPFGNDWMHGIGESNYQKLYKCLIEMDPFHYFLSSKSEFIEYYQKNRFKLYHGKIGQRELDLVKGKFAKLG